MITIMLQGQDIVVLAKLEVANDPQISGLELANQLGLAHVQVHRALARAENAGLLSISGRRHRGRAPVEKWVGRRSLYELLAFGVPYFFPVQRGGPQRGMLTAGSAPVLAGHFASDPEPVVWPDPDSEARGSEVKPLHPCVPNACRADPKLYELLSLVDAIRLKPGGAREREIARSLLKERLL